jgi:hypothetical protein
LIEVEAYHRLGHINELIEVEGVLDLITIGPFDVYCLFKLLKILLNAVVKVREVFKSEEPASLNRFDLLFVALRA